MTEEIVRLDSVEAPDAEGVYRIWPGEGRGPGSEDWTWSERTIRVPPSDLDRRFTRNVVIPTVTVFRPPAGKANGTAMVVAPGGAFHFLMMDHEGYDMARWLAARGVTAFVLKYRLGQITRRNIDFLTAIHVLDTASGHGFCHGFFDLPLKAPDKALPIDSAFVFAIQATVNKMGHSSDPLGRFTHPEIPFRQ